MLFRKRGMGVLEYILATVMFVTITAVMIIWARGYTSQAAEQSTEYAEAKMQCQQVKVASQSLKGCNQIALENKGMLNIAKFIVRQPGWTQNLESGSLAVAHNYTLPAAIMSGDKAKYLIDSTSKYLDILPLIDVNGELKACSEKKMIVYCFNSSQLDCTNPAQDDCSGGSVCCTGVGNCPNDDGGKLKKKCLPGCKEQGKDDDCEEGWECVGGSKNNNCVPL